MVCSHEDDVFLECDESAFACPSCVKGIINLTHNNTFACDKCSYEVSQNEFLKNIRYSGEYLKHCEKSCNK